eukprot:17958-Chlamydomonas_euryale.AAC.2
MRPAPTQPARFGEWVEKVGDERAPLLRDLKCQLPALLHGLRPPLFATWRPLFCTTWNKPPTNIAPAAPLCTLPIRSTRPGPLIHPKLLPPFVHTCMKTCRLSGVTFTSKAPGGASTHSTATGRSAALPSALPRDLRVVRVKGGVERFPPLNKARPHRATPCRRACSQGPATPPPRAAPRRAPQGPASCVCGGGAKCERFPAPQKARPPGTAPRHRARSPGTCKFVCVGGGLCGQGLQGLELWGLGLSGLGLQGLGLS